MRSRILILFLLFLVFWSALVLRSAQLQILPDARLAELQKRQFRTVIDLPPRRGNIIDRHGKELAVSVPRHSLFADPKMILNRREWSNKVAKALASSSREIFQKIRNSEKRFVWIQRHLTETQRDQLKDLKLPGLAFVEESKRIYPNNALLSQVLGFLTHEQKGVEGLEKKLENDLQGQRHMLRVERDARGRPLLIEGRIFAEAPAGADVTLTVDSELQFMLERALYDSVVTHNADSAMGIILDAKTSEVLAMGYAPTYDLNRARQFGSEFWRNRLATDVFEPGSVLKSLVVAGALREGLLKPSTKFNCENGSFKIGNQTVREADANHKFKTLTTSEILAKSSNIGTAKIALKMGPESLHKTLTDFGFGKQISEDFLGEGSGIFQKMPWSKHLQATISFGYGVAATPLQLVAAYAAMASDGILRRPFIVKSVHSWESGEETHFKTEEIRRVLSESEAATMRLMLHQATEDGGTGVAARVPGFPVAGKTGTAKKVATTGGYAKGEYISSFAGMIPANDPRFVIYVAVDHPREKYYGAEVAAPLFARVAGYAVRREGLAPVRISKQNLVPKAKENKFAVREQIRHMAESMKEVDQNRVPELKGLTLREVYQRLKGTPLSPNIAGRGVVAETIPAAGEPLPENLKIKILLE